MAYQRRVRQGKLSASVPTGTVSFMRNLIKAVLDSDSSRLTIQQVREIATEVSGEVNSEQAATCKTYVLERLALENL